MAQRTRQILKGYFETGDKPNQDEFADLIDSLFNLADDGGAKVKLLLEALNGLAKLKKSAVLGAESALNLRAIGDVMSGNFVSGMTNILKGDFWIHNPEDPNTPAEGGVAVGDWVIARRDNVTDYNYENDANWRIQHFGDTTVNQQVYDLKQLRMSPTVGGDTITMTGIDARVINIVINKLTYMGKPDDGEFGNYDYVYRTSMLNGSTDIQLNEDMLGFRFMPGMVVDITYQLNN
ncbi:MAG TPA: hypothetical protein VFC92_06525 [Bacteroidales bacterium]|jgi:hypothetical protein|nr:hypothetical protein [Bacteroidales bacterium]